MSSQPLQRYDVRELWYAMLPRGWVSLAVVSPGRTPKTLRLARSLAELGTQLLRRRVELLNATEVDVTFVAGVKEWFASSGSTRTVVPHQFVVALDSPIVNPLAIGVITACDSALLLLLREQTTIPSARRTIELIGRERLLGAVIASDWARTKLATPLVTLHFAPTESARRALLREGIADVAIAVTGNTVIDALLMELGLQGRDASVRSSIEQDLSAVLGADWSRVPFVLITGHRRESFGDGCDQICLAIATLARRFRDHRFIYPVHLNPNVRQQVNRLLSDVENAQLIEPQGYRNFVALMSRCRLVLTDSGGVQEEAPSLGKPVLVMRDTTERPEGIQAGTALLTGPHADAIVHHTVRLLTDPQAYEAMATAKNPYGDSLAAGRVVEFEGPLPPIRP